MVIFKIRIQKLMVWGFFRLGLTPGLLLFCQVAAEFLGGGGFKLVSMLEFFWQSESSFLRTALSKFNANSMLG